MSGQAADRIESSRGVYAIAVAAEIVGVGPQTLRLYESKGILAPSRSAGGTRRYSADDLDVLRRVIALVGEGVNLPGVRRVIELEAMNERLRAEIARLSSTTA